jgi:N-acetylglucosamine-6-phosphate deacetylase
MIILHLGNFCMQADRQTLLTAPRTRITRARIPGAKGLQDILLENGRVLGFGPRMNFKSPDSILEIDVKEDWISLGGVDLQINGALGLAFPDLTPDRMDELHRIGEFLWAQGIDGYCPTIVTCSPEQVQQSLACFAAFKPKGDREAEILGVHLEGPFLNSEKRGAHPIEFIQPLTVERVKGLLGEYASLVKIMTLAPEMDPTGEAVNYLRSLGIIVSLGHSQATAAQAQHAFDLGATMVTHAFNAMPGLHHREPGLLGAAIVDDRVRCGFIADGQHVSPLMLDILLRSSGTTGLFLVSDALSPLGLPDGDYPWDSRTITVTDGTARLPDGTLSGTTRGLLQGTRNLVQWGVCDLEQGITLSTITPRLALGCDTNFAGSSNRLLRWHLNATEQCIQVDRLIF